MSLNRREMLRLGAAGAGSADAVVGRQPRRRLPALVFRTPPVPPTARRIAPPPAPVGHRSGSCSPAPRRRSIRGTWIRDRDFIGIVDFALASHEPRFHVVHLPSGQVESYRVAHGRGSDPAHCGYLEQFSNEFGSKATSNGAYMTADTYHGQIWALDEGPRPRLVEQQRRSPRDRHPQRLVCRGRRGCPARQARPLPRLLRLQPRQPVQGDEPARRRRADLRRQAGAAPASTA